MTLDPCEARAWRDAFIEHLSRPLPDRRAMRLRRAGFSLVEACTLAANPHVSHGGVEFAATLVEGGLATPFEAIRAVWPQRDGTQEART